MNLIKRLKNLYRLSEYNPLSINQKLEIGDIVAPLVKSSEKAQIIKRKRDPVEDFIKEK